MNNKLTDHKYHTNMRNAQVKMDEIFAEKVIPANDLYANMEGIYSSCSMASSCRRDINFIWLLDGTKAPNHHEVAQFRTYRLPECMGFGSF